MMVLSLFGLIQKNYKPLALLGVGLAALLGALYSYNLYIYRQILTSSTAYRESLLTPVSPQTTTSTAKIGQSVLFEWEISSPVDRKAEETFVLYGSDSSPSATMYETDPDKLPYPNRTTNYSLGNFNLPYRFSSSVQFNKQGVVFYRFYARVDGRDIYTPEYSLQVFD